MDIMATHTTEVEEIAASQTTTFEELDLAKIQNAEGAIDESFIVVHPREELLVFPADQPRPDYAVTDGDVVMSLLNR